MILISKHIDYMDIRVLRQNQNYLKDDSGTMLFDGDFLPQLIFQKTAIEFIKKSFAYKYILYSSTNDDIFLRVEKDATSIQLKGGFFLNSDCIQKLEKIIAILKENSWAFHLTRLDYAFNVAPKNQSLRTVRNKFDLFDLQVLTYGENENETYKKAFNKNFEFIIYNKTEQVLSLKNNTYAKSFNENFNGYEKIFRIEFRLKNKRTNEKLSSLLRQNVYEDFEDVVLKESYKRLKIKGSFKKILTQKIKKEIL